MKSLLLIPLSLMMFSCENSSTESVVSPPVEPSKITGVWQPPQTPGLHLILDQKNKREYFSSLRVPGGLFLGQYGLYEGGPDIQFFDGAIRSSQNFPDRESIFDLFLSDDGFPLATTEHYASIYKCNSEGKWELKYSRSRQQDLMFYICRAGNNLYANWNSFDTPISGLIESADNGITWKDFSSYRGKNLYGMCSDGSNIFLAGSNGISRSTNEYPILVNIKGNTIASRPDKKTYGYWGVIYENGLWNMGSFHDYEIKDRLGFIDIFDGTIVKTVYTTDRPHIQTMQINKGNRYAVATWNWDASDDKTSLLLVSSDGYNWSVIVEIPCPHIIGMSFADEGIFLSGGKFREYGRTYFYRPK